MKPIKLKDTVVKVRSLVEWEAVSAYYNYEWVLVHTTFDDVYIMCDKFNWIDEMGALKLGLGIISFNEWQQETNPVQKTYATEAMMDEMLEQARTQSNQSGTIIASKELVDRYNLKGFVEIVPVKLESRHFPLDQYRVDDYYMINNSRYDDTPAIILEMLGFCGCGLPRAATIALYEVLNYIEYCMSDEETDAVTQPFEDGVSTLIYYMLDDKELTDHGGCVPGWLTAEGKLVLHELKLYFEGDDK